MERLSGSSEGAQYNHKTVYNPIHCPISPIGIT